MRKRSNEVEIVRDEIDAVRHAMARANSGDLVVICVDNHARVMSELEEYTQQAQAGSESPTPLADPDYYSPN